MDKRLFSLLFSIAVVMLGYGITLPVLALSVEQIVLNTQSGVANASFYVGFITGLFPLMQLFFAPVWGKLSDRYNRKYIYIVGLFGYGISLIMFGFGQSLGMFYLSRSIGGLFSAAVFATAAATVAELTSTESRHRGMALLGSASGVGALLGPALGTLLYEVKVQLTVLTREVTISGFTMPFLMAALFAFLAAIYAAIKLTTNTEANTTKKPEDFPSYPTRNSSVHTAALRNPIVPLLFLAGIIQFALAAFEGTFILHASWRQGFNTWQIGLIFIVCGIVMTGMQAFFVSRLVERFGEITVINVGLLYMGFGLVILMFEFTVLLLLGFVALFAFGVSLTIPGVATLISHNSSPGSIGRDMGWMNAAVSFGQAIGPVFGGWLLGLQIHLPYLLIALLLFVTASWVHLSRERFQVPRPIRDR